MGHRVTTYIQCSKGVTATMAKMKFNGFVDKISGKVGGLVVRKGRRGKYTLSNTPDFSEVVPSQAQLGQRKVFGRAVEYANSVKTDPDKLAFYEKLAEQKDLPTQALCVGDYLNVLTMDDLDLSIYKGKVGDSILIATHDDVGVVKVNVELTRTDGTNIERGQAVDLGAGNWAYIATVPVPVGTDIFIEAEAFDRPGNRTVCSANPTVGINN
jgi:hypothetical protein